MHAEIKVGDALIMLGQAGGPWKPSGGAFYLWVDNVDEVYAAGPGGAPWRRALRPGGLTWWIASPAQGYANRVKTTGLRQQG